MIKLSKPSKMPCHSWSTEAIYHCPASVGEDGQLVDACKSCYATGGFYQMPSVKALRQHNAKDWQREEWVDEFVALLATHRYFRWFDSGDVYHIRLAKKILEVMKRTPWVRHWLPTRMYKFGKFLEVLNEMESLDNVVIRFSSDSIAGELVAGNTTSTIIPDSTHPVGCLTEVCKAYERGGKCADCRLCWSKDVKIIAYPMHGAKGLKLIKMRNVA